jgi:hypothetical protein
MRYIARALNTSIRGKIKEKRRLFNNRITCYSVCVYL